MGLDFTELDSVIEALQKKLSPGSPPVMLNGQLVIWRTVRGFRLAIELVPGAGRYNFGGGKTYKGGRVLVGPPSLAGKDIGKVDNKTWGALSGTGTNKTFPDKQTPEAIKSLKDSVKNSLKDDDTRHDALDKTDKTSELVQIARSAGFQDSEIQEALDGKVFQNGFESKPSEGKKPNLKAVPDLEPEPEDEKPKAPKKDKKPSNVVPFKPKAPTPEPEDEGQEDPKEEDAVAAGAENDPKPTPIKPSTPPGGGGSQTKVAVGGEDMTAMLDALTIPGILTNEKKQRIADSLDKAADRIKNELLKKQIQAYADGIRTGDYKLADVKQSIQALLDHRKDAMIAALTPEDQERLKQKAIAKPIVKEIEQHAKQADLKPYTAEDAAADRYFYEQKLDELAKLLTNPQVVKEVQVLRQQIKSKRMGGNSVILRLLQILRLILAFIPGV